MPMAYEGTDIIYFHEGNIYNTAQAACHISPEDRFNAENSAWLSTLRDFIFYIFLKRKRLICLPIKTALHQMFGPISKYATHYGTFASWKDYFSEYPDSFGYFHRLVIHKRHVRRPHLFIINIHRLSRWFFICGHSPMFFAARKTRNTVCQLRGFVTCRPWTGQLDSSWVVRPFHPVSICMR